ncbi:MULTISPECIES: NAD(P)/FAD-dependent oxidoreductase [unclassified Granulicatella]|uniref:NAD(P)/FAD-dependent oxidoreductase n=1 Tax=unclassified Granulicatella TaxID=2630493 RepID=UPI0010747703|nr:MULTISPECIES: NAD(P)/FAD-dependent oxidoreductase [unclassified Granulicatella]MBF0779499.1 NAD(P)/FAD-dependent oxidoreductase [Granulicatella sp. 19428wC4_WM01]TFU96465.1 NAD(P)/FAD-dependent oxidoreductase [Granulicatella sp. WM01]
MTDLYDITIIGGGPVGLFAAFYAHLRQAKVKIIDSLHQLGGQPAMLYPEKTILDVPAFMHVSGQELIEYLKQQLSPFDTTVCLNETVEAIHQSENFFNIQTSTSSHVSKTVIIAMGLGAFKPRTLDLDGIHTFKNIYYHVQNQQQFANQHVVVLGGGDSAVDWALSFEKTTRSITLIHRREEFRALEHSVQTLHNSSVSVYTPYLPTRLIGKGDTLTHLELTKVRTTDTLTIPVDSLFVNYGFHSSIGNLKDWGLTLNRHKICVNTKQETSIPGIYAIGDCCTYDGKIDLIATGLGEAPTAVSNALHFINPKSRIQPMHSTSL